LLFYTIGNLGNNIKTILSWILFLYSIKCIYHHINIDRYFQKNKEKNKEKDKRKKKAISKYAGDFPQGGTE